MEERSINQKSTQRTPRGKAVQEPAHRINEKIITPKVRLTGDNIENQGIYSIKEALRMSEEMNLDLVEIAPNADPPVCRIIDYQKFLYDQKKRLKEQKAKASKVVVKEIRFGPNTDEHDFEFKKNHAIKFLQEGAKIKAFVFFKGRTILFKEKGEILLLKLATELEEWGKVEQLPKLEGKRMTMFISPKKQKK
ncbi:MAG TPA: translation initiation factor IF-3 [Salinivirgaceae bacterium]|nr:translation initiation factor IF-3 [Salinivirgaceae bacterium]HQA76053.1 translation initiation factor IF-3 [Salinivirgaceae bacterium]